MSVEVALRRAAGTWPRRLLLGCTLLVGALAALAVAALSPVDQRTFVAASAAAQSLMSVTLPFVGVLLTADLRRPGGAVRPLAPTLQAAAVIAVVVSGYGVAVCALVTAVFASATPAGPWQSAGLIAVGSILLQLIAMFVGTGCGLLFGPPYLAMLATVVAPLGVWLLLGRLGPLAPARDWVTPFAALQHLFTGRLSAINWLQWALIAGIWAVVPNVVGARRLATERA